MASDAENTGDQGDRQRGVAGGPRTAEAWRRVRAFVRDTDKAEGMLGDDVELAINDFENSGRYRPLDGVDGVFLACSNQPQQVEYETA